ncbi:MAG TPA: fumarylacetoacetate hydrolase family protein [Actinocrinis sp.]|jgi:2-dehydro-3-deoxy-D-arabinonate dehydratase
MSTQIVRYVGPGSVGIGLRESAGGDGSGADANAGAEADADAVVRPLALASLKEQSLAGLLELRLDDLRAAIESAPSADPVNDVRLLPPIDGLTEVWAAGVTYHRSSEARQEESQVADVYARVYDAARPELFFKSPAWRVCGHGEPIGVRADSSVDVPEPELAVVCNAFGEVVGLTVCNDVSSRSIEGENPLYLPQAKIYSGSCALGPGIVPIWQVPDPKALDISVTVLRAASGGSAAAGVAWAGRTSTSFLRRGLEDLVEHLFRQALFPQGVVLSTGTGLVPALDFTLLPGDEVAIEIGGVGRLANPVREAGAGSFGWLTPAPDRGPS